MLRKSLSIIILLSCIVLINICQPQAQAANISERDAIFKISAQLGALTRECTELFSSITDYGKKIDSEENKFYIYLIAIEIRNLGYKAVLLADVIGATQLTSEEECYGYSDKVYKSLEKLKFFEYDHIYSTIAVNLKDPTIINFVRDANLLAGSLLKLQHEAKELLAKQLKK